jgi:hypothetical protein
VADLKTWSYPVRVTVQDGKPLCPHCGEPMAQTEPDTWSCPIWAPIIQQLGRDMAALLDGHQAGT